MQLTWRMRVGLTCGDECVRSVSERYMPGGKGGATAAAARTSRGAETNGRRVRVGLAMEKRRLV